MSTKRQEDEFATRCWFRSDRMFQEGDRWYFLTREGTVEGPYGDRFEAARMLEAYVRVMSSAFNTCWKLSLEGESTFGKSSDGLPANGSEENTKAKFGEKPSTQASQVQHLFS